uniref:Uncharacterized protein n=1 Tax=Loa loa TaxID=7209 RepID=A0A1I7V7H9_LOALO
MRRWLISVVLEEDTAFSDPLSDYAGDFDIVRFLDENRWLLSFHFYSIIYKFLKLWMLLNFL